MKKSVSHPYTQLTLNFEYEATTTAPVKPSNPFSQEEFVEWQAIEQDIMNGRGDFLCKQNERYYAHERQKEKVLEQFEAVRASIYQLS